MGITPTASTATAQPAHPTTSVSGITARIDQMKRQLATLKGDKSKAAQAQTLQRAIASAQQQASSAQSQSSATVAKAAPPQVSTSPDAGRGTKLDTVA